jgi:hypothetical protein
MGKIQELLGPSGIYFDWTRDLFYIQCQGCHLGRDHTHQNVSLHIVVA